MPPKSKLVPLPLRQPFVVDAGRAVDFLRICVGLPISPTDFRRLCDRGEGPKPYRYWGRRPLWRPLDLEEWARSQLREWIIDFPEGSNDDA
jgi:hypothetical protein